jgi:murein peptide amidase A
MYSVVIFTSTLLISSFFNSLSFAEESKNLPAVKAESVSSATSSTTTSDTTPLSLSEICKKRLSSLSGPYDKTQLDPLCAEVTAFDECKSFKGEPIFHYDKIGTGTLSGTNNSSQTATPNNATHTSGSGATPASPAISAPPKKVLVFSLIHGDEFAAGSVARAWMARLRTIEPRNTWRMIPVVNPDGLTLKTRTNARKVDLNRNFPSKDWEQNALAYWKKDQKSDKRRYPGPTAASEPETRCLIKHIEEFKPDFIISIHTPLGLLDFDGPRIGNPGFKPLPWVSLGNYPGSLGRYMWADFKVPVLTIELKGNIGLKKLEEFDRLQDITGTIAIQADKILKKEEATHEKK